MLNHWRTAALGLACFLAGCATNPRNRARAPDWESEDFHGAQAAALPTASPPPAQAPAPPASAVPAHAVPSFADTWIPLNRWCKACGLPAPTLQTAAPSLTCLLSSTNGTLLLRGGTIVACWNGMDLRLGFAPQSINGQPFVHYLDLNKTVQPLLLGESHIQFGLATGRAPPVIVIDPGHGGENAGTRSAVDSHFEKEFTLDWALRLKTRLESQGWLVFLTRTNDRDVAISNRVALAQEHQADLFVSLHFNSSAPNNSQVGLETYCLTPTGMPSTVTRDFEDDPAEVLPNNAFDLQNLQLALSVHHALLEVNGHHDRGVRRARFPGVLRGQQRPAILIEGGYLSNPQEARLIAEPEYRQKLADAVARGLGVDN